MKENLHWLHDTGMGRHMYEKEASKGFQGSRPSSKVGGGELALNHFELAFIILGCGVLTASAGLFAERLLNVSSFKT